MIPETPLANYTPVKAPYDTPHETWDDKTAKAYFAWFLQDMPARIAILEQTVHSNAPQVHFVADFSPESLVPLGAWLKANVHVRRRDKDDTARIESNILLASTTRELMSEWVLTKQSLSLTYDAGIYFGEVLRRQFSHRLYWDLRSAPDEDEDYNQPVFGGVPAGSDANPIRVVIESGFRAVKNQQLIDLSGCYVRWVLLHRFMPVSYVNNETPLTNYTPVKAPYDTPHETWDDKTAKAYFAWFLQDMPARIAILEQTVHSNAPQVHFVADFSPESLVPLGAWLKANVHIRKLTEHEIMSEVGKMSGPLAAIARDIVGEWTLSEQSTSLAHDVGIYLGESLRRRLTDRLRWQLRRGPKDDVDYNLPVLHGLCAGKTWVNTIRAVEALERKCATGLCDVNGLRRLYESWNEKVNLVTK